MKTRFTRNVCAKGWNAIKLAVTAVVALTVVGCSGGNPYVTNADRNEIITVGDSIFDLSGEKYIPFMSFQELAIKLGGVKC